MAKTFIGRFGARLPLAILAGVILFGGLMSVSWAGDVSTKPAPVAAKNPDVTFHAPPRPLAKDAVTEDWPCFLGPRHNGFSKESRLAATFSPGGLPVVWEMHKGEGYAEPAVADGRLILFHRIGNEEVVDCLDAAMGDRFCALPIPRLIRIVTATATARAQAPPSRRGALSPSAPKANSIAWTCSPDRCNGSEICWPSSNSNKISLASAQAR